MGPAKCYGTQIYRHDIGFLFHGTTAALQYSWSCRKPSLYSRERCDAGDTAASRIDNIIEQRIIESYISIHVVQWSLTCVRTAVMTSSNVITRIPVRFQPKADVFVEDNLTLHVQGCLRARRTKWKRAAIVDMGW
jgi:hypothetical protein